MTLFLEITSDGDEYSTAELGAETITEAEMECADPGRDGGLPPAPCLAIVDEGGDALSKWTGTEWRRVDGGLTEAGAGCLSSDSRGMTCGGTRCIPCRKAVEESRTFRLTAERDAALARVGVLEAALRNDRGVRDAIRNYERLEAIPDPFPRHRAMALANAVGLIGERAVHWTRQIDAALLAPVAPSGEVKPHSNEAAMLAVVREVSDERRRQDAKWGEQNHPDGTSQPGDIYSMVEAKGLCQESAAAGECTWRLILDEEVKEAFAALATEELRAELVQVSAVAVSWIQAIDRRVPAERAVTGAEPERSTT